MSLQANKPDPGQTSIASVLPPPRAQVTVDVTVVGAGPAGLFLASELGKRGLKVNVIGGRAYAAHTHPLPCPCPAHARGRGMRSPPRPAVSQPHHTIAFQAAADRRLTVPFRRIPPQAATFPSPTTTACGLMSSSR